jgi:hypothetical protein
MKLIVPIDAMTMAGGFLRFIGVAELLGVLGLFPAPLQFIRSSRRSPQWDL